MRPVHLGDAAYDVTANYRWLHDQGGIALFATIGETSISTPSRYANGATIKTAPPMPLAAVFADPMATIMKPKAGNTSVAWPVPSVSGDPARTDLASWATRTACVSTTTHA